MAVAHKMLELLRTSVQLVTLVVILQLKDIKVETLTAVVVVAVELAQQAETGTVETTLASLEELVL